MSQVALCGVHLLELYCQSGQFVLVYHRVSEASLDIVLLFRFYQIHIFFSLRILVWYFKSFISLLSKTLRIAQLCHATWLC